MHTYQLDGMKFDIDDDFEGVFVEYNGKIIGRFELKEIEDDASSEYVACHINVDEGFRRKGIAIEMVKHAVDVYGYFSLPDQTYWDDRKLDSCEYFTPEGLKLFQKCERLGIIKPDFFRQAYR